MNFIYLLLYLSLINISNGVSQEDNDVEGNSLSNDNDVEENSLSNIPDNSDSEQSSSISNFVNQTASSTSTSNQSDRTTLLDNERVGSLEENFNPEERSKAIIPR